MCVCMHACVHGHGHVCVCSTHHLPQPFPSWTAHGPVSRSVLALLYPRANEERLPYNHSMCGGVHYGEVGTGLCREVAL